MVVVEWFFTIGDNVVEVYLLVFEDIMILLLLVEAMTEVLLVGDITGLSLVVCEVTDELLLLLA